MRHHDYDERPHKAFSAGIIGLAIGTIIGLLFSPRSGRKNRMMAKDWMRKMHDEVDHRVHETKDMTETKYNTMVDEVAKKYSMSKDIAGTELEDFVKDLKMRWGRIKHRWQEASEYRDNER